MKTLVAYYSRTGHTKFISEKIAQILNADLCQIADKKNREGRLGFLGGGKDALREKLTDIEVSESVEGYDLVIIGTPVWAGKITPAIRKFMVTNDFKEKAVALFVTLDGNKPEKSLENMKEAITAKRVVGEKGFIHPMGDQEKTEQQIKNWCEEIQKATTQ
jgi:flavodoxin